MFCVCVSKLSQNRRSQGRSVSKLISVAQQNPLCLGTFSSLSSVILSYLASHSEAGHSTACPDRLPDHLQPFSLFSMYDLKICSFYQCSTASASRPFWICLLSMSYLPPALASSCKTNC